MFMVEGKIALVTGGASGLGFLYVKELLKHNLKGVCMVDINEEAGKTGLKELKKEYGENKVIFVQGDVSDKNEIEDAFKKTIAQFKNLDIVINNAGILEDFNWEKTIRVNVNGNVLGNLLALDYIQKYRSSFEGAIVNISSIAGMQANAFTPIYTTSKTAVLALSRSFGLESYYERTKVKVISVCPGRTHTPLLDYEKEYMFLSPEYKEIYRTQRSGYSMQLPSHVAENLVKLIEHGKTGSIWVIEDGEPPYEVEIPAYTELRKN